MSNVGAAHLSACCFETRGPTGEGLAPPRRARVIEQRIAGEKTNSRKQPQGPDRPDSGLRHARVRDEPAPAMEIVWVVATHRRYPIGAEDWCVEYWDGDGNAEAPETFHASEVEATRHAEREFGPLDWRDGFPPVD
jgi:hypothetical protein